LSVHLPSAAEQIAQDDALSDAQRGGVLSLSGILRVTLSGRGEVIAGRLVSVSLTDGLLRRDFSNTSGKLVEALSRQDFPSDHFVIGPSGLFHLETPKQRESRPGRQRDSASASDPRVRTA
jgi:hypothetical protein